MSYTAKTWRTLNDFKVNDLNSLERGVQEAHEGVDLLRKDFTTTKIAQDKAISQINSLLNQSGTALQAIKDIENILVSDKELSEILKNYGTDFLSKESQTLSNKELKTVYENLKLNQYKFFTSVTMNGQEILGDSLNITTPQVDNILNLHSQNAISNSAVTQALNNIRLPNIDSYLTKYATIDFVENKAFNTITAEMLLRQQGDTELRELLESHSHNDMATRTFVRNEISLIPTPDVSGQINTHNLDKSSHPDIWEAINNMDLSDYALVNHTHDNSYSKLDHTHDYASSDHTHNYATQSDIDNAIANIEFPEINFDGLATEDFVSDSIKGLASTSYVDTIITNHNKDANAHPEITTSITNIQTSVNTISGLMTSFAKSEDVVKKSGDTMSGTLTIGNITLNPSTNTISTNKLTLTNLSESSSTSKLVVLDASNNAQYRSLTGLKSDLNITNDINTAIQGVKDWLLGTGNADTIDTIKDIADIMEKHKDVLDTLGNTYALKEHNHDSVYSKIHSHPYASDTHNHDTVYSKIHDHPYAPSSHTHSYLPLSGGTISKDTFAPLYIQRSGSAYFAAIGFQNSNGILGSIGMSGNPDGGLYRLETDTTKQHLILDASNFSSYALPLSGGKITGPVTINAGSNASNWSEGIYTEVASNGWATFGLGTADKSSLLALAVQPSAGNYRFDLKHNGGTTNYIYIPGKTGTIALTSDLDNCYKLNGNNKYVSLTDGSGNNTAGYRLVSSFTAGTWGNYRLLLSVTSRHQGTGLVSIGLSTHSTVDDYKADINYWGSTVQYSDGAWRLCYNPSTALVSLYWYYNDYSSCSVSILQKSWGGDITNGTWTTSIPESAGTQYKANYNFSNTYAAKSHTHTEYASSSHDHNSSYLKLDGSNTMTGKLNLKATGANDTNIGDTGIRWGTNSLPQDTAPQYICTIDGFANGGRQKWASIADVATAIGLSNYVDKINNQSIAGNKTFTGTTSTMDLNCYSTLRVVNGSNNALIWNIVTDTNGNLVFKHS